MWPVFATTLSCLYVVELFILLNMDIVDFTSAEQVKAWIFLMDKRLVK